MFKIPSNIKRGIFDEKKEKLPECNKKPNNEKQEQKKNKFVSGFEIVSDAVIRII